MTEPPAPIGGWRLAEVAEVRHPGPRAVILRMSVPDRVDHLPGQHYVVRLTAEDGYTASRSYSVASAPADPLLELFIERLDDGEVSGYLADVVEPGDHIEVRGPIGGWFVWSGEDPALLIGGGTGVVPLVAMVRHAKDVGVSELLTVVAAARTSADLPYARELMDAGARVALSRETHAGRSAGRLTGADIDAATLGGRAYVCGSAGFAESASQLVTLGVPATEIRVERFGPTS